MSWRTGKPVVGLRKLGRALGLNRLVASLFTGKNYEDRFQSAMLEAVRAGDVVWDVGANVGLYSKRFAAIVGGGGMVIAFEPSPQNLIKLRAAVETIDNIAIMAFGLGERDEELTFEQGADDLGATSRFVGKGNAASEGQVVIKVLRGDGLIEAGDVPVPNVIKIDTEGFELDVLLGIQGVLENAMLRTVCVEVHFGLLEARGLSNAAADIEKLLSCSGFSIKWPDVSHIIATRMI